MADDTFILEGRSKRAIERRIFGDQIRVSINRHADPVTRSLFTAYARGWAATKGIARQLAKDAAEARHSGLGLSEREVARLDRVDRAMLALERQVRELGKFTGVRVRSGVSESVEGAVDRVLTELPNLTGVDRRFTKPSGAAMEGLIFRLAGQIESSATSLTAEQQAKMKDSLFRGLVLGENPRTTAKWIYKNLEGSFLGGANRADLIARTEIADAHRYATRLAYNEDDLIVGWKWLSTLSARTCPACWAMHNTFHEKSEAQFGHPRCRCTMVPVLVDDMPYDHDLGDPEQIFWNLPRETQQQIMGPGRLKALEAGVRFTDLTYLKTNPEWRPSQQVTSVADLTGIAELNVATFPGDVIEIPGLTNASLMSMAFAQGGMTIHTATGDQPTSGYVVARRGTSLVIDAREFFGPAGPTTVAAWMAQYGDRLDAAGAHMGMWYDTENGKVVLDVVEILNDREEAIALGRAEDQIAIFDLNTFSEIATGGTGGYAGGDGNTLKNALTGLGMRGTGTATGTADDPINVGGNVLLAAKLIGEGKHVRLNRIDEVGTLLDELARLVEEAKAKGEDAPDFDLCRVSVAKLNLFCAESKGIPRIQMPQLGGVPLPGSRADQLPRTRGEEVDILPQFREALEGMGIAVTDKTVLAKSLKATQNQLIGPKVAGISAAMETAPEDSGLFSPIFVTRDGYVLDGHHRWAASVARDARDGDLDDITMNVMVIDMEIGEALAAANAFAHDWGIPQQGFTGAGFIGKLTPDEAKSIEVGETIRVIQDGVEKIIRVTDNSGGATVGVTEDGSETVYAWPDQIVQRKVNFQRAVERARELAKIADDLNRETDLERVNLAGMDVEAAKRAADAMKKVMDDWPHVDPLSLTTGPADSAFAMTSTSFNKDSPLPGIIPGDAESNIIIDEDYAIDPARWTRDTADAEARGHFHRGSSDKAVEYTVDHEFGHATAFDVWGQPDFNPDPRFEAIADAHNDLFADEIESGGRTPLTLDKIKAAGGLSNPALFEAISKDLSGYGISSMHELFAEAFSVFRDHGPGESVTADAIMRHIARGYFAKYGEWPSDDRLRHLLPDEYVSPEQGRLFQ